MFYRRLKLDARQWMSEMRSWKWISVFVFISFTFRSISFANSDWWSFDDNFITFFFVKAWNLMTSIADDKLISIFDWIQVIIGRSVICNRFNFATQYSLSSIIVICYTFSVAFSCPFFFFFVSLEDICEENLFLLSIFCSPILFHQTQIWQEIPQLFNLANWTRCFF